MNHIKNHAMNMACKFLLKPKQISSSSYDVKILKCSIDDIQILKNTSNNVMRITTDNEIVYFRECKQHKEIHEYVNDIILFYFSYIETKFPEDYIFIRDKLLIKSSFKKFVNMGMTNDTSSGAYHFCIGDGAHYIGLDGMMPDMEERTKNLVQFIWGDLFVYRLNAGLKIGEYQTYNAVRSIATYRIANLLGLQEYIPQTEYGKLYIDGEFECFGTLMKAAPGLSIEDTDEKLRAQLLSPALQRSLINLTMLDVLCLEKDHRPGNYNVNTKNGKATGICAFDNDSPNSFGIGKISFETYLGCSPLIVNNQLNRPYIDATTAQRILDVTDTELYKIVGDILNIYQLLTLKNRLHTLQKIINKFPRKKWLTREMWSDETIKEELSGSYGTTYLTKFLEKQKNVYQPWLKKEF